MRLKRPYVFLFATIIPLLVVSRNFHLHESIHQISLTVLKPFLQAGHTVAHGFETSRDSIVRFWKTFREQEDYEKRLIEMESKVEQFEELRRENLRFKQLLEFKDALSYPSTAARVIGWDSSPWKKTVILDKGTRNKLGKDMAVVVAQGLVGRVIEAGPVTSRVILLTDPDSRVSALTDESRAHGVIAGNGSAFLEMKYLELDININIGETVLTSGIGGLFPKGLRIGKVESIQKDSDGLHLVAKVNPFVEFSKIEEVLCIASSLRE